MMLSVRGGHLQQRNLGGRLREAMQVQQVGRCHICILRLCSVIRLEFCAHVVL